MIGSLGFDVITDPSSRFRSQFDNHFPYWHGDSFRMDAGVVISKSALDGLTSEANGCNSSFMLNHAGRALLMCARKLEIAAWSPADEGRPLFTTTNRLLHWPWEIPAMLPCSPATECLSPQTICIGALKPIALRVIHFAVASNFTVYGL
jgi:hypothetical protein